MGEKELGSGERAQAREGTRIDKELATSEVQCQVCGSVVEGFKAAVQARCLIR